MAKKTTPATVKNKLPANTDDFSDYAGAGLENVTSKDLLVPRLTILQALSPQVNKRKSEYIEGSEVGQIADVGTGEVFPDGVIFLPVYFRKDYLEWAPRDSGRGLVAIHSDPAILDQTTRNDRNQPVLANGNYIAETAQFFGLNLSTPDRRKCFVPMTSTQLKKARKWNTLASGEKLTRSDGSQYTPPLFYRTYNLTTAEESNNDGDWVGWVITRGDALPEASAEVLGGDWHNIFEEAKQFLESLRKGEVGADVSSMASETPEESSDDGEEM